MLLVLLCNVYVTVGSPPLFVGAVHVKDAVIGVGLVIVNPVGTPGKLYVVAVADEPCAPSPPKLVTDIL